MVGWSGGWITVPDRCIVGFCGWLSVAWLGLVIELHDGWIVPWLGGLVGVLLKSRTARWLECRSVQLLDG